MSLFTGKIIKLIQKIHLSTGIPSEKIQKAFIDANWDPNKAMEILEYSIKEEEKGNIELHQKGEVEKNLPTQNGTLKDNKIETKPLPSARGGWYEIVGVLGFLLSLGGGISAIVVLIMEGPKGKMERYDLSFFEFFIMIIVGLLLVGISLIIEKFYDADR